MSFSASLFKSSDLRDRILITLGVLFIYRLGTYVPLPGVDIETISEFFNQTQGGGIIGMFNLFSGGALERMSMFALNVMPYISASIIMQLVSYSFEKYKNLRKQGEAGRRKIEEQTRYLTVLLAMTQGYGIAVLLESVSGGSAVIEPGLQFKFSATLTLVAGTMFLTWLGERVTEKGIGNGVSLIIFAGIVAELPPAFWSMIQLSSTGALPPFAGIGIVAAALALIVFIVFVEQGQRRIQINYPGQQGMAKRSSILPHFLPLKINPAGVLPPVFATAILLMPLSIIRFFFADAVVQNTTGGAFEDFIFSLASMLGQGQPLYMFLYGTSIVFFSFFYIPIVFNAQEISENLKKSGGFITGIRAGKQTAEYLNNMIYRLNVSGAIYLLLVCLIPEFLIGKFSIPFYFGGTSFLIMVGVALDFIGKIQSHIMTQKYKSLMKRARVF